MLAEAEEYAKRLLNSVNNEDADDVVQQLVWDYPSHNFVIDRDEALEIGLPVKRMDVLEEKLLTKAILGLGEDETSFYGFVAKPRTAPTRKRKERPKSQRRSRKMPTAETSAEHTVPIAKRTGTAG